MKGKNMFATRWGIIGVGACVGITDAGRIGEVVDSQEETISAI